jgi:(S)-ureidoglycine-glyoxylate aminotransferase
MNQPLADIGEVCKKYGVLYYCDATASIAGNELKVDEWHLDAVSAGLQKCLGGPSGSAPITLSD